jgi:hypothetical protein
MIRSSLAVSCCLLFVVAARADEESLVLPMLEVSAEAACEAINPPGTSLVLFAGRTVEFEIPRSWAVKEVPFGREIRALAGPGPLPDDPNQLEAGFWLAYRPHSTATPTPVLGEELRASLARSGAERSQLIGRPKPLKIDGLPALQQNVWPANDANRWLGRVSHVVVPTPWGLLEMRALAPLAPECDVSSALQTVLASLRFHAPAASRPAAKGHTAAAQNVFGSWKGLRSRLHLTSEGVVELEFDRPTVVSTEEVKSLHPQRGQRQTGRFTAEGDVIYITWSDGSRLNYRWALKDGELFLRDPAGGFHQLQRLFDPPLAARPADAMTR